MYWKMIKTYLGNIVEILKNPSISELPKRYPGVRAFIVDKQDLYVWEYDSATHHEVMNCIEGKHIFSLTIIIDDELIIFTASQYSKCNSLEKDELIKIENVKCLIEDKNVFFFGF